MTHSKNFDYVEMKREASSKICQQIESMTPDEEIKFWRSASKKLKNRRQQQAGAFLSAPQSGAVSIFFGSRKSFAMSSSGFIQSGKSMAFPIRTPRLIL